MRRDVVMWGETELGYRYRLGSARTLSITVHPDRSVEVVAPQGATLQAIRAKILKRAGWIARARRQYARLHPLQPARQFVPGETHRYLGRQYRLRYSEGATPEVRLHGGFIVVTAPRGPNPRVLRRLLRAWYARRADEVLRERMELCAKMAAAYAVPPARLAIRPMATRWGSCSERGLVTLNPELIKAPKDCIDYVICHELCHRVQRNHSQRFWKLLRALIPDWEDRRARLNQAADVM
jgi:predicted metal-dependent hydrolase